MAPQTRGYTASKDQLMERLAKIEGQVRGVAKMVEQDRYCIDIVTQINAVRAALDKVGIVRFLRTGGPAMLRMMSGPPTDSMKHDAGSDGATPVHTDERQYVCPMHPEVVSPTRGRCTKCGMDLRPRDATVE